MFSTGGITSPQPSPIGEGVLPECSGNYVWASPSPTGERARG